MSQPDAHPDDSVLEAYCRGKLDEVASQGVVSHLQTCSSCRERMAKYAGDDVGTIPASHTDDATLVPPPSAWPTVPPEPHSATVPMHQAPPGTPAELSGLFGYQILKKLGEGGMGVVYLAHNTVMDRREVLKVMNKSLVGHPEAVERFLQEIRAAAQLIHTNVATAFSVHPAGELLILAMEFVDGSDLAQLLREHGPLPVRQACHCVYHAALGLQRGYDMGLVHRDIKPGNLLLTRQGKKPVIKIVDFGLAKAKTEVPVERELTGINQMMGTPGYSAPEQLRDAKSADIRSDIYSLGCTLYALLTGHGPFQGNNCVDILMAQQNGHMEPLRQVRPEVPEALAALVARMMAKNPADRPQLPREVAQALVPFLRRGKSLAGDSGTHIPVPAAADTFRPGDADMELAWPSTLFESPYDATVPATKPAPAAGSGVQRLLTHDEMRRQFVEEVKLRAFDDRYIDKHEEREILEIAIRQGATVDSARTALIRVCADNGFVVESCVLADIKELLETFVGNDGKLDEREFNDAVTQCKKKVQGKKNETQVKRMVIDLIEDNGYKPKTSLFSNWYARVKKDAGVA